MRLCPERGDLSSERITRDLRSLTSRLVDLGYTTLAGALGGEDDYGAAFENEVFGMHPYCWCERPVCSWRLGCTCEDDAYLYFIDDQMVTSEI
jgi:hypothetical protein